MDYSLFLFSLKSITNADFAASLQISFAGDARCGTGKNATPSDRQKCVAMELRMPIGTAAEVNSLQSRQ